jgi:hypothetical protein
MESYKWLYNLIIWFLYVICVETLHNFKAESLDSVVDWSWRIKERELLNRLDPSIKHHLRKAGISMIQNVYSGFDTEFKIEEICLNTLISTQLAISTKTFIKITRMISYKIPTVDIQSNKLLKIKIIKNSSVFNY